MKKQYLRYKLDEKWVVRIIDEVAPAILTKQQSKSFFELSKHLQKVVKLRSYEVNCNSHFDRRQLHQELLQCYQLLESPVLFPLISHPETREHFLVSVNKEIEKIERGDYEPVDTLNDYQRSVKDISIELIASFDDKKNKCLLELRDVAALKDVLASQNRH
jgi:hypothetical protein